MRFVRPLLAGTVLIYAAVVLTLGGTVAAKPVLYAALAAWLTFLVWRRPVVPRWLDLGATNVTLGLVLAESALQAVAACTGHSLLLGGTLDAHRLEPGRDYGAGLVGNRLGYPGAELGAVKPPGPLRIAALGDSFAVGPAVPFADNYLTRLGNEAGAEIANFGVSGAGPREYRAILERDVWRVQPDLVLVSIFVGNDITETLPEPRHLDPRRHAVFVVGQRAFRLIREHLRGNAELSTRPFDRLAQPPLSAQTFREVEARRLAVCVKQPSAALEKKWSQALAELDRIIEACRQRGVAVRVVLIPDEFQVNPAVLEDALRESGLSRAQIDLELPQRRLVDYFARRGVPCLDLLPAFRGVADTYAPRDTHWNVRGNHLAAREIGRWLKS